MPRTNPSKLKRPVVVMEESPRVFTDPLQPGESLSVWLAADPVRGAQDLRDEKAAKLMQEWLPVSEEEAEAAKKAGITPRQTAYIASAGASQAIITPKLCTQIAHLMEMEERADGIHPMSEDDAPHTFREWVLFAQNMPTAFNAAVTFAGELLMRAEGKLADPNSSAANGAPRSDSPSTDSTGATTPNSSSAVTP